MEDEGVGISFRELDPEHARLELLCSLPEVLKYDALLKEAQRVSPEVLWEPMTI